MSTSRQTLKSRMPFHAQHPAELAPDGHDAASGISADW